VAVNKYRYLFGERWQAPLARAIGVSGRTTRRWAAGQRVPDGVIDKLVDMAAKKSEAGKIYITK